MKRFESVDHANGLLSSIQSSRLSGNGVDCARSAPVTTGRPSYHPSCLLKLYGYLNRVQSSRRLEREAGRNVEVIWLLGRFAPDHKTIADFRKDNGGAIKKACARFRKLNTPGIPCTVGGYG
jgi:transposase